MYTTDVTQQIPYVPIQFLFKLRDVGPVRSMEFLGKLQDYFRSYQIKFVETELHNNRPYQVFEFNGVTKGTFNKEDALPEKATPYGCYARKETRDFIFSGVNTVLSYLYEKDTYDRPGHPSLPYGFAYTLTISKLSSNVRWWEDCPWQDCEGVYRAYADKQ